MPIVMTLECDGCWARLPGAVAVRFGDSVAEAMGALQSEAESLGWENVRLRTWYCRTCRRARDGESLTAARQPAEPGREGWGR